MDKNASEFLVEMVSQYPGDVTILALGPLTNIALVSICLDVQKTDFYEQRTKFALSVF